MPSSELIAKSVSALDTLFPEIASGSRRRAHRRDMKELQKEIASIDSNRTLNDDEKAVFRYSSYRTLGHIDNLTDIIDGSVPLVHKPENVKGIDPDWVDDFQDKAGKCSNSDLQIIWSQILAGEIDEPGRFSKRFLSIVSTLEKSEAEIFKKVCSYSVITGHKEVYSFMSVDNSSGTFYNHKAIALSDLSCLFELGLMDTTVGMSVHILPKSKEILQTSKELVILYNSMDKEIEACPVNRTFSKVGEALASLCDLGCAPDFHRIVQEVLPEKIDYEFVPVKESNEKILRTDY